MAFARPNTNAPKVPARGKSGSASITGAQARHPNSRPASRTPSVSSTSSRRSSSSKDPAQDNESSESLDASSQPKSRPTSVCSTRSAFGEPTARSTSPSSSKSKSTVPRASPSVNTSEPHQSGSDSAPQPTTDSLQVAAQLYPWIYMTSTLEACFKTSKAAAEKDIAAREAELAEEESDFSEQRVRLEAERRIEFYEELSTDKFTTAAPSVMQAFTAYEEECTTLESEALKLATSQRTPTENDDDYYSPMRPYNALLEKIEQKQREQQELHASIVALTQDDDINNLQQQEDDTARVQLLRVFSACLPVLQARAANLQMAYELLEGAKENLAMSIHLESLQYSESEEE
ncbi:hypothetical protein R3P38DRAFT_2834071 [Favolaschia claudopus]|uniref:Uncharacterized protein n=1 Tax=Favolaschia claudopus TaxID=2862362 RepID=A0AAW0EDG1_9AGAR